MCVLKKKFFEFNCYYIVHYFIFVARFLSNIIEHFIVRSNRTLSLIISDIGYSVWGILCLYWIFVISIIIILVHHVDTSIQIIELYWNCKIRNTIALGICCLYLHNMFRTCIQGMQKWKLYRIVHQWLFWLCIGLEVRLPELWQSGEQQWTVRWHCVAARHHQVQTPCCHRSVYQIVWNFLYIYPFKAIFPKSPKHLGYNHKVKILLLHTCN